MIVPTGLLLLAAGTSRPVDVIVRWERPTVGVLLFGALAGAALALAGRIVWARWRGGAVESPEAAPAVREVKKVAAPGAAAPRRKWNRRATTKVGSQARALVERGASEAEVARRLGVSQDAVAFAMRRAEGEASAGRPAA